MTPEEIAAIRARVEAARPQEEWARHRTELTAVDNVVLYDDNDHCAVVEENLGLGCVAESYAELFAHSPDDIRRLLAALESERARADAAVYACAAAKNSCNEQIRDKHRILGEYEEQAEKLRASILRVEGERARLRALLDRWLAADDEECDLVRDTREELGK